MPGLDLLDRSRLSLIHGMSSNVPASRRDASMTSTDQKPWKAPNPTVIQTPSNASSHSNVPQRSFNPYSSNRMRNTLGVPSGTRNRTADRTVLGHISPLEPFRPTKRPRLEPPGASNGKRPAERVMAGLRTGPAGVHSHPETIFVDAEYDLQVPLRKTSGNKPAVRRRSSSPDPLDILPGSESASHPIMGGSKEVPYDIDLPSDAVGTSRVLASDGEATKKLQERVKAIDVDEIEAYSSDQETLPIRSRAATPNGTKIPAGAVRKKIDMFNESDKKLPSDRKAPDSKKPPDNIRQSPVIQKPDSKRQQSQLPPINIDLKNPPKMEQSRKNAMKGKAPTKQATLDALTRPSGLRSAQTNTQANGKAKRAPLTIRTIALPLETWILGCQPMQQDDDSAVEPIHWLVYTDGPQPLLAVREKKGLSLVGRRFEEFRLPEDIKAITLTQMPCNTAHPVIVRLRPSGPSRMNVRQEGYNPGSNGYDGRVTFKLQTDHASFRNNNDYTNLVQALEASGVNMDYVDGPGSNGLWQQVMSGVEVFKARGSIEHESRFFSDRKGADGSISTIRATRSTVKSTSNSTPLVADPDANTSRRSSRLRELRSPSPEPDELMLVYPPSGAGAININKSDFKRLNDLCYLNDTLIEFGLKLWLADLRENEPELAEEVHVFSSFFYKKLNVRDKEDGYRSVRKWTSKFDIFKKKYIIVPINENFHWYLAIIYRPEHVLLPPLPPAEVVKPLTRKRKRESGVSEIIELEDIENDPPIARGKPEEIVPDSRPSSPAPSYQADNDAEKEITPDSRPSSTQPSRQADSDAEKEVEQLLNRTESCTISEQRHNSVDIAASGAADPAPVAMEVDEPEAFVTESPEIQIIEASTSRQTSTESAPSASVDESTPGLSRTVPPNRFYSSTTYTKKGKEKARDVDGEQQNVDVDEVMITDVEPHKSTYVFIFDSLGSKHPQAIKTLSMYLQLEAKDKKGNTDTRKPIGKLALVPGQGNYADCGVYLLHYVRKFLKQPEGYSQLIMSTKSKGYDAAQRLKDWEGTAVASLRQELKDRILELSEIWKADRSAKEQREKGEVKQPGEKSSSTSVVPASVDDSDDEVVIEEVEAPAQLSAKGRSTARSTQK